MNEQFGWLTDCLPFFYTIEAIGVHDQWKIDCVLETVIIRITAVAAATTAAATTTQLKIHYNKIDFSNSKCVSYSLDTASCQYRDDHVQILFTERKKKKTTAHTCIEPFQEQTLSTQLNIYEWTMWFYQQSDLL